MNELGWKILLCKKRQRQSQADKSDSKENNNIARNEFEADYDRIVGSSSVRRLQDKAQVFPLQENDFTRTRLTHSIEVSAMARSLGKAVGRRLEKEEKIDFTAEMTDEFAALLQTAGLIHDLGNPPFGHYGEMVIRQWFSQWFCSNELLSKKILLSQQEKNDFIYFDGNVQNLRIVTKLQTLNDAYGANFTYATLATIMKYPWKSSEVNENKKKFGYFQSEEDLAEDIMKETGLAYGQRHPATYLLEAADDIIYICDDIEDGVKKGYIQWEEAYNNIKSRFKDSGYEELFCSIDDKKTDDNMEPEEQRLAKVRNFRNYVQTYLFSRVIDEFMEHYNDIMSGKYQAKELLKCEDDFVKALKGITRKYCFSCHEVLALELVGDRVIRTLLDIFTTALVFNDNEEIEDSSTYSGKIYHLISANFKYIALYDYKYKRHKEWKQLTIYDKLHLVVDFISGMTDSYAVNLYKELTGINIPS